MIKAFILDLDNTIFPTPAIADELFKPLYKLLDEHKESIGEENIPEIERLLTKKAWQKIAEQFEFEDELLEKGNDILRDLTYDKSIDAFPDYELTKSYDVDKFLVTMGFTKMQHNKVDMLAIKSHFKEVIVNDPEKTEGTKKEVFEDILKRYQYQPNEVLVIGDDPESEIESGNALGLITVIYDRNNDYQNHNAKHRIANYSELNAVIDNYND